MKKDFFLLLIFSVFSNSCFNCDVYLNKKIKPISIKGVVVSKNEINCFGEIVIRQENTIDTIKDICSCTPQNQRIWDHVISNDSLHKEAGS